MAIKYMVKHKVDSKGFRGIRMNTASVAGLTTHIASKWGKLRGYQDDVVEFTRSLAVLQSI